MSDLTLTPPPSPRPKRPPQSALAEALAANPDQLLALVAELPPERRQQVIAVALGRAIADAVRDAAGQAIRALVAEEAPRRVAKALDGAAECYQWSAGRYSSLAEMARDALRKELAARVQKEAAALADGLMGRVRLEVVK